MTPEDVIKQIRKGWPNSVYAAEQFWHVQYVKQLEVHTGPDLAAGFQRVLENLQILTKGTPPKPDVIAAECRRLKQNAVPETYQSRKPQPPPPSKQLTPIGLADTQRQITEMEQAINNGTAGPLADTLLRVWRGAIVEHQRVVGD